MNPKSRPLPWPQALEQFSRIHPHLVVRVTLTDPQIEPEATDTVLFYRGMGSSLSRSTPADLSTPIIAADALFLSLDLVAAPYDPQSPRVIQAHLTWDQTQQLLAAAGIPT